MKEKKYVKSCPGCGCEQSYKHAGNRDRAVKNNAVCRSCSLTNKPFSAETRAKMSDAKKGKKRSDAAKASISATMKGRIRSDEHKANISAYKQSLRDAYTETWGDKYKFPSHYFNNWSKTVKARDNKTCQKCATKKTKSNFIDAHHIVPSGYFMARALDIDNGVTLCRSCHQQVHAEHNTYVVNGVKFTATDFINHYNGWKPNGKK